MLTGAGAASTLSGRAVRLFAFCTIAALLIYVASTTVGRDIQPFLNLDLTSNPPSPTTTSEQDQIVLPPSSYFPSEAESEAESEAVEQMFCPPINSTRYGYLRDQQITNDNDNDNDNDSDKPPKKKYFIALNLRTVHPILPRLLSTITTVIRHLGPSSCTLSIVEGNSDDLTFPVLSALTPFLENEGIEYHLVRSDIDPSGSNRIGKLAELRNLALEPLLRSPDSYAIYPETETYSPPASQKNERRRRRRQRRGGTVLFVNDILPCPSDLLELLHQRLALNADMTCGMDWRTTGGPPSEPGLAFYDVWVARQISGDTFFDLKPDDPQWRRQNDLLLSHAKTTERYAGGKPFQVFSCWNGGVAFRMDALFPSPSLSAAVASGEEVTSGGRGSSVGGGGGGSGKIGKIESEGLRFRPSGPGECFSGEPQMFCKDLWLRGMGKIAVVPSVNFEYTNEKGKAVKEIKGYVEDWLRLEELGQGSPTIDWLPPPKTVRCLGIGWRNQDWRPWDEPQELLAK
ncbi:Alpha-1,3-mannosyltransferase [Zalerion maritima]|uniref:Alpha-1,3-mannosyltransferase n=1 Tax=Zalerion maritima TaxID=339359 RepID=A0AAD5WVL3_9PEZI|nr:Alpha-1,3-mannosyltransferase [Zalerion maritima]